MMFFFRRELLPKCLLRIRYWADFPQSQEGAPQYPNENKVPTRIGADYSEIKLGAKLYKERR